LGSPSSGLFRVKVYNAEVLFCYYPCPCDWHGDPVKECTCSQGTISRMGSAFCDEDGKHTRTAWAT